MRLNPLPHLVDMPMSLGDHLHELRRRLMVPIAVLVVGFLAAFAYNKELKVVYAQPLLHAIRILGPEHARDLGLDSSSYLVRAKPLTGQPKPAEGKSFPGDGGPALEAALDHPTAVAVDAAGNLFIADQFHSCIRKVDKATGAITTVAGTATAGFSGDGGPATAAELDCPGWVSVDAAGDLFIADTNNQRIRKVDAATGVITTVAGNGAGIERNPASIFTSTGLGESAMVSMSVSFYAALALTIPFLVYQIWRFVSVGLLQNERQLAFLFVPAGIIFFYTGAVLGYFWGLPYYFAWLLEWSAADPTLKEQMVPPTVYQSSFTMMTVCFGLMMDIPWLVMILVRLGFVTTAKLARMRKFVILINTVIASLVTPPDGTSMIVMMIPLQLLFEGGLLASRAMMWYNARHAPPAAAAPQFPPPAPAAWDAPGATVPRGAYDHGAVQAPATNDPQGAQVDEEHHHTVTGEVPAGPSRSEDDHHFGRDHDEASHPAEPLGDEVVPADALRDPPVDPPAPAAESSAAPAAQAPPAPHVVTGSGPDTGAAAEQPGPDAGTPPKEPGDGH